MGGASRNTYEGHVDKAKGSVVEGKRQGWAGQGHGGVKLYLNKK